MMDLLDAATIGDLRACEGALQRGSPVNDPNRYGHTPLINASHNGHLTIVDFLVRNGAQLDKTDISGETALIAAAKNGHLEVVRYLVECGANVKIKDMAGLKAKRRAKMANNMETYKYLKAAEKGKIRTSAESLKKSGSTASITTARGVIEIPSSRSTGSVKDMGTPAPFISKLSGSLPTGKAISGSPLAMPVIGKKKLSGPANNDDYSMPGVVMAWE
eukprot:Colp12_sorted_trinity150504_noHs@14498